MLTLEEVKEKLTRVDEISLMEILNINSEDLVEAFEDRIDERYEELRKDLE